MRNFKNIVLWILIISFCLICIVFAEKPPDVEERLKRLEAEIEKPEKDNWDKVQAISGLASGIFVALIGFYAANIYNKRQKEREEARKEQELLLNQAQTVEAMIPHLASTDERVKEAALLTISSMVSDELATELALKFGGEGSRAAATKIVLSTYDKSPNDIRSLFGSLFSTLRPSVVQVLVNDKMSANGFYIDRYGTVVTAAHVVQQPDAAVRIRIFDETELPATVAVIDKDRDTSLLSTGGQGAIVPVTCVTGAVELGSQVVALWESPGEGLRGEVGTVSAIDLKTDLSKTQEIGVSISRMLPGISGAPAFNVKGQLVGFVHAYNRNTQTTYLISTAAVLEALSAVHDSE